MPARTKDEIRQKIADSASYREDLEFIQEALDGKDVFIGQLNADGDSGSEVMHCVTVGMFLYGLPEMVFTGVPVHMVKAVVSEFMEGHDFDRDFLAGKRSKIILGFNTIAVPVDAPATHEVLEISRDFYTLNDQPDFRATQIVFADEHGAFPWSDGYSEQDRLMQPVLGMGTLN